MADGKHGWRVIEVPVGLAISTRRLHAFLSTRTFHDFHLLHDSDFQSCVVVLVDVKHFHVDESSRCAANVRNIRVV